MDDVKAWIKKCEGLKLFPYQDTVDKTSIGWGRNLSGCGISQDEADLMFDNDFKRARNELSVYSWYLNQPQAIKNALLNMNFNLGIEKFLRFKKMIAALEARDYTKAAIEALDSAWAKEVPNRAKDIALMIRAGR